MPPKAEKTPAAPEGPLKKAERQRLLQALTNSRDEFMQSEFDPVNKKAYMQLVFNSNWKRIEPYVALWTIMGAINDGEVVTPREEKHLNKMAAWKAQSMDRRPVAPLLGNPEKFWQYVDEKLQNEIAAVESFPEDLTGVPREWKNALHDLLQFEAVPLSNDEPA